MKKQNLFRFLYFITAVLMARCGATSIDPCHVKIKQPKSGPAGYSPVFKVYNFGGEYVVGTYERLAKPNKDGVFELGNPTYDTVFVRLVFDPRIGKYYPFPENQSGPYNTIWEDDSCKAKEHWRKYTKQWVK